MTNPVELVNLFKNVSPRIAQTFLSVQKMEKSVASMAKVSRVMGNSEIGKMLGGLAKAGEKLAGQDGIISFVAKKATNVQDATLLQVVIKKGEDAVAKLAAIISRKGKNIGGNVTGSAFHYSEKLLTPAEKFRELAAKLGVDISTAQARLRNANGVGMLAHDEKTLTDIILGKYNAPPASAKKMFASEVYHTKYDPMSLDKYFGSGYRRLGTDEPIIPSKDVSLYESWEREKGVFKTTSQNEEKVLSRAYSHLVW